MRRSTLVPLAFVLALIPLAGPLPADAYMCAEPRAEVWPKREGAPTNAVVRIVLPEKLTTVQRLGVNNIIEGEAQLDFDHLDVELRNGAGVVVPVARKVLRTMVLSTMLLTPKQTLASNTHYQVVVKAKGEIFPIGDFTTGNAADSAAPTASAVKKAGYVIRAQPGYKGTSGPFARVDFKDARDAGGTAFSYEVHALDDDGKANDGTLRAVVEDHGGKAIFGKSDVCAPSDFVFAAGSKRMRVGLRPVDMAGNVGPLLEVMLDLAHPLPREW